MDTSYVILCIVIVALLAERVIAHYQYMKQQDMMNKALISRTTGEYTYNAKEEVKKIEAENELARHATTLIESQDSRHDHIPIT